MSTVLEPPSTLNIPALPGCVIEVHETMDEWLKARDLVIGASESPSILGVGYADESPLRVWSRKRGHEESKPDTEALECGRVLQPAILDLFMRRTGLTVSNLGEFTVCKSITHPWLAASLDGVIADSPEGPAVIEAKNVSLFMSHEWDDEDQPLKFQVQIQQQMAVAGVDRAYTVGLIGGNKLRYVETRRNQKFIDVMVRRLSEFMEMVESGEEPSGMWIDGSEATKKALEKIHPLDNGQTIVLPLESTEWHEKLADAKARKKQAIQDELLWGNHLRRAIGDNSYGLLPDGSRYSYKHGDKEIYTCSECGHVKRSEPFPTLRKVK